MDTSVPSHRQPPSRLTTTASDLSAGLFRMIDLFAIIAESADISPVSVDDVSRVRGEDMHFLNVTSALPTALRETSTSLQRDGTRRLRPQLIRLTTSVRHAAADHPRHIVALSRPYDPRPTPRTTNRKTSACSFWRGNCVSRKAKNSSNKTVEYITYER